MNIITTPIEGVIVIEPEVFQDSRGCFFESFREAHFHEWVDPAVRFVQDNESHSQYGVVRGLHFQIPPHAQAKLVRVVLGEVMDVAVDLRRSSPTYGRHVAVRLSGENKRQLFLPKGMAHGFATLSREVIFQYRCDSYYAPENEGGIDAFDPDLAIDWGIPLDKAIRSEKDLHRARFIDFVSLFE